MKNKMLIDMVTKDVKLSLVVSKIISEDDLDLFMLYEKYISKYATESEETERAYVHCIGENHYYSNLNNIKTFQLLVGKVRNINARDCDLMYYALGPKRKKYIDFLVLRGANTKEFRVSDWKEIYLRFLSNENR